MKVGSNDELKAYQRAFEQMKGKIHILERIVPIDEQMEYFKLSKKWRKDPVRQDPDNDEECGLWYQSMINPEEPLSKEDIKLTLVWLANSRNPKSYNLIKQYMEMTTDPELLNWAAMASMDIQIALESELSEEKQIYVATGLGGKGEKLRFYILLYSNHLNPIEDYQRNIIEREFSFFLPKMDCELEKMFVSIDHVELLVLIPIQADINHILTKIITECNEYGNFLSTIYTITNLKIFSEEEIAESVHDFARSEEKNNHSSD